MSALESKLDFLEKQSRCSSIEIRNLPKQNSESKQSLSNLVQNLGLSLGLETPIQASEIRDVSRSKSNAVIVNFTTTYIKEDVLSKFIAENKACRINKEPPINSQHLKLPGPQRTNFISELLNSKAKRLFYMARQYVKDKKVTAAWTSFGKVYVKKEEGSVPTRIDEEMDIIKLSDIYILVFSGYTIILLVSTLDHILFFTICFVLLLFY